MQQRPVPAYRPQVAYEVEDTEVSRPALLDEVRRRIVEDLRRGKLQLPPFPRVALELHKIAQSRNPDLFHACKLIQREVDLAGRVVKSACSVVFGARPVDTLEAAAMRLGVEGLRDVAMMTAMGKVMRAGPLQEIARDVTRHSFVVAVLTQWTCVRVGFDKGRGFMCGLFHDVGRLAVALALSEYSKSNKALLDPAMVKSISDELHAQVGSIVLSSWGLHNVVKLVAQFHHTPRAAGEAAPLARAVAISDAADRFECASADERYERLAEHPEVVAAKLSREHIRELADGVDKIRADEVLKQFVLM